MSSMRLSIISCVGTAILATGLITDHCQRGLNSCAGSRICVTKHVLD
jgi:hypothetical protein